MRYKLIILLLLLPLFGHARKQGQARIDSLLQELPKAKEDTNKVMLLNDLSINMSSVNPDEGIKLGQQALELSRKLNWDQGTARANSVLGTNYHAKSDFRKALEYDFKSLEIYQEAGNKNGIAAVTNNIGIIYQNQSNYPKALEYYFKALMINEETGNKPYKAANLSNIGEVFAAQSNWEKALEYDLKSLAMFEELDNKNGVANQLSNAGMVYASEGNYPKAHEYYFRALKINQDMGNKSGTAITLASIGDLYLTQKKYTEAQTYLFGALKMNKELGNKFGVGKNLGNIGELYLDVANDAVKPDKLFGDANKSVNLRKAISYLDSAITVCKENSDLDNISRFSLGISEAYILAGNDKAALESYKLHTVMKDSVFSTTNKVKITNLETEREIGLADKQLEIDRLAVVKKRNERGFFIAGIMLLMVVIVFVVKNYNTQKRSNELLSKEKNRSDELLLNILPAEVADELKATGRAVAKHFDNVTVLFTDFVNFTEAGERMTPQQLIDELDTCFKAFDKITGKYNIEKIKTIGDAYLAAAGLPLSNAMHAENVVRAAQEIRAFMQDRKNQIGDKTFDLRIGIHSGSVVAGIVGVKKFAYDIWGDTVNTAARMEEKSESGKINISQTTYELVKDKFVCEYRGEIAAKNKGGLRMYFVNP